MHMTVLRCVHVQHQQSRLSLIASHECNIFNCRLQFSENSALRQDNDANLNLFEFECWKLKPSESNLQTSACSFNAAAFLSKFELQGY